VGFVDHLRLSVSDLDAAERFYDPLMAALGFERAAREDGGLAYGRRRGSAGRVEWLILTAADGGPAHRLGAPGLHHVAFAARDRAQVDVVGAVLRDAGARILEGPKEYDDEPDHYAVFCLDPDGIKLEVVAVG
jgi:catechol 2,3-dioxygenase-like lactoylglutathione lyase family enzyme